MKQPKTNPAPVPPPIRWSVGVVAHNEGGPDSRLRAWLAHWSAIVAPGDIHLLLHDCNDDSAAIAAEFGVKPVEIRVAGLMESILWETVPYAHPDSWHVRCGGVDEFIGKEQLDAAAHVIRENDGIRLFWVARKNSCDGVDISQLLGWDWQCAMMRPHPSPIRFHGGIHAYPEILFHASAVALMNPRACWIEHNRTFADIERCNRARDGYGSPAMIERQERFIGEVRKIMAANGRKV